MYKTLTSLLGSIADPVSAETRTILRKARNNLPRKFHTNNQFIGRQYAGCGATIGVMPRCDFACRGCYLNHDANRTPAEPVEGIKHQLRTIRDWLGESGNVQITDGEATLRPVAELVEIIRYAREIGLVPMLMTHGDSFRKSPQLLSRLVVEGGLSELSIHIDTTQRGRMGSQYRYAESEQSLAPLRDEFAEIIRAVRRETGKSLEVATTVTVTQDNIKEIPEIVRWVSNNADAFKMISFQPLAQVGRTDSELAGAGSVDKLWAQIAAGLNSDSGSDNQLVDQLAHFGHPDCTNFVQGLVVIQADNQPIFHPLFRPDDTRAINLLRQCFDRFGGVGFRLGSRWQKTSRAIGLLVRNPKFFLMSVIPFAWQYFATLHPQGPLHLLFLYLRAKVRINYLNIVSHHFMNRQETETPLGRERLDACVFKVPINGKLVSMCEVNALGIREQYYASIDSSNSSPKRNIRQTNIAISEA